MTFIVETGSGTPGANAYAPPAFVTSYLTDRGRETQNLWSAAILAVQQEACVVGTDFLDKRWGRRTKGSRLQQAIAGRVASGSLLLGGLPLDTETLTVGQKVYRLVASLAQENDILIGGTVAETVQNIIDGINQASLDVNVHEDTQPNYEAVAQAEGLGVGVVAKIKGENGNFIAFSTTITGATISGSGFLAGGLDETTQPLIFPRRGLYGWDGRLVVGIPLKVKQAMAEYAVRGLVASLDPDPEVDASLVPVVRKREKVGPIEEETEYAIGGIPVLMKPYPAGDRLMQEYVLQGGTLVRG